MKTIKSMSKRFKGYERWVLNFKYRNRIVPHCTQVIGQSNSSYLSLNHVIRSLLGQNGDTQVSLNVVPGKRNGK